jgi:hypothetical protein
MKVNYKEIDSLVESTPNLSWDGWTVLLDKPNHGAWMRADGVQIDGTWFSRTRIEPGSDGNYDFKGLL